MYRHIPFHAIIIILTASLLSSCGGNGDDLDTTSGTAKAVIVSPNAALRIDPILQSARIALLKKGEPVDVLERSKQKTWVGKSNDYWFKIKRANGITGWTYGQNIKILRSGVDSIEQYLTQAMEDDTEEITKAIVGKWWSVNSYGDFTYHCLELGEDRTYKSYTKGSTAFIEGEYSFDLKKNQIIFSKGATFGKNLDLNKRGQMYFLQIEKDKNLIQFKQITDNIPEPEEEQKEDQKTENTESGKKDEAPTQ